ncbi:MAG: AbrB/MazE/SpoVT family DNA-binding domain-containing protein [bacterium]|nr:AbrB/MazE/SpoVT family DNA-binding domain-containing protein [bacterium]
MSNIEVKLIPIGNSKGIRIPKAIIDRYGWKDSLILEEEDDYVVLRGAENAKLSWEETYQAMASEQEDWSDLEVTTADGLDHSGDLAELSIFRNSRGASLR